MKMSDKFKKIVFETSETLSQSIRDNTTKENAEFRAKENIREYVIREAVGGCCPWCEDLVGKYIYGQQPKDFFRRHANCTCIVSHVSEKGYQNVWNKKTFDSQRDLRIDAEREFLDDELLSTPRKERVRSDFMKDNNIRNVYNDYVQESTPGKGNVDYDEGLNLEKSKEEIKVSKNVFKTFGGDIKLLNHENYSEGSPDYIWNGMAWELKSPVKLNGIDGLVRKGLKQIANNPGGLIIDIGNLDFHKSVLKITDRINRHSTNYGSIDVIIIKNNKVKSILRYE